MEDYNRSSNHSLTPDNKGQPQAKVSMSGMIDQDVYREQEYEGCLSKKPGMDTAYEDESPKLTEI